jgi:uncharacterized damage-inducible protein DinB
MSLPHLEGQDLIAWLDRTSDRWRNLLMSHPEALEFPCDIRETKNVDGLLHHVVAVELRYAERLCGLTETPYDQISYDSAETVHRVHQRAMKLLFPLSEHGEDWWQHVLEFGTRSGGQMQASRRVIFMHLLLHSIRHYAQLATIVRQHGIDPGWMMDYLDMRLA